MIMFIGLCLTTTYSEVVSLFAYIHTRYSHHGPSQGSTCLFNYFGSFVESVLWSVEELGSQCNSGLKVVQLLRVLPSIVKQQCLKTQKPTTPSAQDTVGIPSSHGLEQLVAVHPQPTLWLAQSECSISGSGGGWGWREIRAMSKKNREREVYLSIF